jgi:CelD/BcsL family acetyltransferase involved in cellulose biosynthesis
MNDLSHPHSAPPQGTAVSAGHRLQVADTPEALAALRPDWERLWARDPEAGVFLSYAFLAPALLANPGRWRIYLLRDARGAPLCLFPAKRRLHWSTTAAEFQTELDAAGRLAWGEYVGFICHPAREEEGLTALARALAAEPWKNLALRYEPTGHRARLFAEALGPGFSHRFRDYRINGGTVDNLAGLVVPLSEKPGALLARLKSSRRQKLAAARRRWLDSGIYQITESTPETVEGDIAGLLLNWITQWAPSKGADKALEVADRYGRALLTAEEMDCLYLPTLWRGSRRLGALGHLVDAKRGEMHFLVAGRDTSAEDPAIGLLLQAHAIDRAAEAGLARYSFGHGDEPYKRSFAPEERRSHYLTVRRRGAGPVLDPAQLPQALTRLAGWADRGETERLAAAARQLAEVAAR